MRRIFIIIFILIVCTPVTYAADISAQYACMINAQTLEPVYEKSAHERHSMASTTKIMTAITALEMCSGDEIVTVSANASRQEGSSLYLKPGEKIRLEDLLYGLMLNSGNDAAVAVAEHVSGSVGAFADEMNKKAAEIGAADTSFKNPNGLDEEGHFSTAYDMAIIGAYAMRNEKFREIVGTQKKTAALENSGTKLYFSNHNKLLKQLDYVNGIKTGYTKATGRCLVSSAEIDGMSFIICTLNAPDDWNDHKKLYEYAKNEYERRAVIKEGRFLKNEYIDGMTVSVCAGADVYAAVKKNGRFEGEVCVNISESIKLPIKKGDRIGMCGLYENGRCIAEFDAVSGEDVIKAKKNIFSLFKLFFGK